MNRVTKDTQWPLCCRRPADLQLLGQGGLQPSLMFGGQNAVVRDIEMWFHFFVEAHALYCNEYVQVSSLFQLRCVLIMPVLYLLYCLA